MYTLVESLINVYLPKYAFSDWQATLLIIAFVIITALVNTFGARLLPMLERISLGGHFAGFIITVISLWVLAACPQEFSSRRLPRDKEFRGLEQQWFIVHDRNLSQGTHANICEMFCGLLCD